MIVVFVEKCFEEKVIIFLFFCTKREKIIGKGAFGSVWRGRWKGRVVAIKEARADKLAEAGGLLDEAQVCFFLFF